MNDGTAKWELCKISDAESLEGTTLEQLLSQIKTLIPVTSSNVKIITGNAKATSSGSRNNFVITIPLPSGFRRSNCKYWINTTYYRYYYDESGTTERSIDAASINQNTGTISYSSKEQDVATIFYLLIAVK